MRVIPIAATTAASLALHDRCDANTLLPGCEEFDAANEQQIAWMNEVMAEVSRYLILRHEGLQHNMKGTSI